MGLQPEKFGSGKVDLNTKNNSQTQIFRSKQQNFAVAGVLLQQLGNSEVAFIFVVIEKNQNELIFLNKCDRKKVITLKELFFNKK